MNDYIDINAGEMLNGVKTKEDIRDELIVKIGYGHLVKAELNEQNDFSIWRNLSKIWLNLRPCQ